VWGSLDSYHLRVVEKGGVSAEKAKKRPSAYSAPGRLGSPPPELPNHNSDIRASETFRKYNFRNSPRLEVTSACSPK